VGLHTNRQRDTKWRTVQPEGIRTCRTISSPGRVSLERLQARNSWLAPPSTTCPVAPWPRCTGDASRCDFLLFRVRKTPRVADRHGVAVVYKPMSRDGTRRRRRVLVGIVLAMLTGVGLGRNLVSLLRPSGQAPPDAFGPATRRVTGPGGAELAGEESGPQERLE
jgi:hypothetical protein